MIYASYLNANFLKLHANFAIRWDGMGWPILIACVSRRIRAHLLCSLMKCVCMCVPTVMAMHKHTAFSIRISSVIKTNLPGNLLYVYDNDDDGHVMCAVLCELKWPAWSRHWPHLWSVPFTINHNIGGPGPGLVCTRSVYFFFGFTGVFECEVLWLSVISQCRNVVCSMMNGFAKCFCGQRRCVFAHQDYFAFGFLF